MPRISVSSAVKSPARLLIASSTPTGSVSLCMGTQRMERVWKLIALAISGFQRGSSVASLTSSGRLDCSTEPAMLPWMGTGWSINSGSLPAEVALKRSSRVLGSSSRMEAASAPVRSAASSIIRWSSESMLVVELRIRLTSTMRASRPASTPGDTS